MLPQRRGLGGASKDSVEGASVKGGVKKRRGGERSRRKKEAARVKQAKEEMKDEETRAELHDGPGAVGLFSFINTQLGES